jgi:hypothetical protein
MAATFKKTIGAHPEIPAVPPSEDQPEGRSAVPADPGRVYIFEKMPGRAATRVQLRIAKVAAEPFAAAFVAARAAGANAQAVAQAALVRVAREVLGKLEEDEFLQVQEMVFASVKCDGDAIDLDKTFADRPEEAWEVLIQELRWTFESFFRGSLFASKFKFLLETASRPSSPPTSTPIGTSP